MPQAMKTGTYLLVCLVIAMVVLLIAQMTQPRITTEHGRGYDGSYYAQVAEQLERHETPAARSPYVFRVGTPLIVARMSGPLIERFYRVNLVACVLLALALACWFRLWIDDAGVCIALVVLYCTQWHAPLRFTAHYPCMVDPAFMACFTAGLVMLEMWRRSRSELHFALFLSALVLALVFREIAALLVIAFVFADNPLAGIRPVSRASLASAAARLLTARKLGVALLAAGVLAAVKASVQAQGTFTIGFTVSFWWQNKPLYGYLYGVGLAFGPAVLVLILHGRSAVLRLCAEHQYLAAPMLAIGVMGWLGGSDTERILYWGAPFVLLFAGRAWLDGGPLLRRRPALLALLALAQVIAQRLPWTLPTFPNTAGYHAPLLTIPSSSCQYYELYSCFAIPQTRFAGFVQFFALISVALLLLPRTPPRASAV